MLAVLLVLALAAGSLEVMGKSDTPSFVSPTLEEPYYRPGRGTSAAIPPQPARD